MLRKLRLRQKNGFPIKSVYKEKLFVGHMLIEISSLCFHFLNHDKENKIKVVITGTRHRKIGLVVLAKFMLLADDQ